MEKVVLKAPKSDVRKDLTCPTLPKNMAHYTALIHSKPKIIASNSHAEVRHELYANELLKVA